MAAVKQLSLEEGHGAISGKASTPCSTPEAKYRFCGGKRKKRFCGIITYNVLRKCLKFESDELNFSWPLNWH